MGDVVTLPIRPGAKILRLMRPEPRHQPVRIDAKLLEIGNHAAAANGLSLQMLTSIHHGGCICERDVAEAAESFARGFIEACDLLGAPGTMRPVRAALMEWLTQPHGGPHDAA